MTSIFNSWLLAYTMQRYFKELLLASVLAAAATILSQRSRAPVMLFARLIRVEFHFIHEDPQTAAGEDFAAKTLLGFAIGLLGLRLTVLPVIAKIGYSLLLRTMALSDVETVFLSTLQVTMWHRSSVPGT